MEQNPPPQPLTQTTQTIEVLPAQEPTEIWKQIAGESDSDYTKFLIYREMGASRSLKAANEKALGKPLKGLTGNWKKASNRWNWSNRALAWDKYTAIQVSDKNLSYREQAETDTQASIAKIVNILRQCIEEENEEKYQKYSRKLNMLILGKGRAAELLLNVHKQLFGEKQQVENTHNFKHIVMLFE